MVQKPQRAHNPWSTHERQIAFWSIALGALTGSAFEMTVNVIQGASWGSLASWLPLCVPVAAFLAGIAGHRVTLLADETKSDRDRLQMALMLEKVLAFIEGPLERIAQRDRMSDAEKGAEEKALRSRLRQAEEEVEKDLEATQELRINPSRRSLWSSIALGALALLAALIISAVMPSEATSGSQHPQLVAGCQPCVLTPGESARITFRVTGAERVFVDSMQVNPSVIMGLEVAPETSHSYRVEAYNQHGMSRVDVQVAVIE